MTITEKISFALNELTVNNYDGTPNENGIKAVRYLQEAHEALSKDDFLTHTNLTELRSDEIKKILDGKYECYILIGQEEEFNETDLYLNAYTMGIMSLLEGSFKKYPPLKRIIKEMCSDKAL